MTIALELSDSLDPVIGDGDELGQAWRNLIENAHTLSNTSPGQAEHRRRLVRSVEALHANFDQAFLDEDSVRDGINDAKALIEALSDLEVGA